MSSAGRGPDSPPSMLDRAIVSALTRSPTGCLRELLAEAERREQPDLARLAHQALAWGAAIAAERAAPGEPRRSRHLETKENDARTRSGSARPRPTRAAIRRSDARAACADREPLARQARETDAGRQLMHCFPCWTKALDHLRWAALVRFARNEPVDPNDRTRGSAAISTPTRSYAATD